MNDMSFQKAESMLDVIASMGVTKVALQSLTYRSVAYNLWLLWWKEHYKKMELSVFGMVHNEDFYAAIPFEVQAKALLNMGCDGIKMMYSPAARKRIGYGINDPRYDKMFDYLEEHNVPLLIHVNDPEAMWERRELTPMERARGWGYFEGGHLTKEEIYAETFEMLDKHPRLRVTFAHFFFLSCFKEEAERVMEKYPCVSFDLTPGWEMFIGFSKDTDGWRNFFKKYSDRIFFGTDSDDTKGFNAEIHLLVKMATSRDDEFLMPCYKEALVRGLGLDSDTLDKIYIRNYERLIGTPKEVNTSLLISAAERVLRDIDLLTDEKSISAKKAIISILKTYKK